MNKYKTVCLFLGIALIACIARLCVLRTAVHQPTESTAEVVLSNILQRKSVRAYTDDPITREQIDTLLLAGMAAPSAKDLRPWKFVVVDERAAMDTLAAKLPYAKMLTEAVAAIVVCGDLSVTDDKGNPAKLWVYDCSAVTQNILLQAEAMGLGAVWTATHPYEERMEPVSAALSLPDHIVPLCVIPLGHPKGDPQPKEKYDSSNIHFNKW